MSLLRNVSARRVAILLGAFIVIGGFVLALVSSFSFGLTGSFAASNAVSLPQDQAVGPSYPYNGSVGYVFGAAGNGASSSGVSQVTTVLSTTTGSGTLGKPGANSTAGVTQGSPSGAGGLIEFSSQISLQSRSPEQTASGIVALAYSVGGYVAYQSTYPTTANVVIRVPAGNYQSVLSEVVAMGKVVSLSSTSNDVRVQYTDLNATVASLRTEQGALLRLLNQSTSINSTLAIESQLQGVNQQINDVESQILQTATLVNYATLDITVDQTPQQTMPAAILSASPRSGTAPLSVTFNAVVKGGAQPYIINYNFGDGDAAQGQIVIHTFFQAGEYNVTVNVTDQAGNTTSAWTMVHVSAAPAQSGLGSFMGTVGNLFFDVLEGIVEVAVVVLPLAAVGAIVILPLRRRGKGQKEVRQS